MTLIDPTLAIALAGTVAVRLVALPKVVDRAVEPHITVDPVTKFVPVTVNVNCAPPCVADVGFRPDNVGAAVTVNVAAVEAAEALPFWTVTLCGPAAASSPAVTSTTSWVALGVLPACAVSSVVPQYTVEPAIKLVPVTVIVRPLDPAAAVLGFSCAIVGALTVNVPTAVLVLPVATETLAVPADASWAAVTAAVSCVALT